MKCSNQYCAKQIVTEYEEVLQKGLGKCPEGHTTHLPGDTRFDYECECGARKAKTTHAFWCPSNNKNPHYPW